METHGESPSHTGDAAMLPTSSRSRGQPQSVGSEAASERPRMRGRPPQKILVVRLGAIGDCLRVLPAVERLRAAFPAAEIGWAVGDLTLPILEGHPAVTRLHVVRRQPMKAGLVPAWSELRRMGDELAA